MAWNSWGEDATRAALDRHGLEGHASRYPVTRVAKAVELVRMKPSYMESGDESHVVVMKRESGSRPCHSLKQLAPAPWPNLSGLAKPGYGPVVPVGLLLQTRPTQALAMLGWVGPVPPTSKPQQPPHTWDPSHIARKTINPQTCPIRTPIQALVTAPPQPAGVDRPLVPDCWPKT
jgi:hypothetical protein